jgi:soluble lytic murein transglycosylase-like protein
VHQQAYRDLAANPGWGEVVRAEIPEDLRDAFDLTQRATSELLTLTTPRTELPAWRIVAPPPLEELRGYYAATEAAFDVPWSVLAAIHLVETRMGRIRGDSHAGAQGPMQFMPRTWEAYGEGDVQDPRDAIMAAGRYLAASGAPGDLRRAVFAYNRSDYYVEAVLAHAEAIERFDHYLDVYHRWRVYYRTVDGDVVLEEGYGS